MRFIMKLYHFSQKILLALAFLVTVSSCSDFFETDLNSVVPIEGRKIQTQRQAFYQMCGILQLMQQVGDSYVISSELRADNVTQTENSSQDLRDIELFHADSTNAFLAERKMYTLINNCNYYLQTVDSAYMGATADTLSSQVKCIRAWAYMQLALDYGKVYLSDTQSMNMDQLADYLIEDLKPYCPADGQPEMYPFSSGEYATINSYATSYLFFPVRYLLGELYMWKENFTEAAHMYYQLILDRKLTVTGGYRNRWRNNLCEDVSIRNWEGQFSSLSSNNQVTVIPFSTEGESAQTNLPDLFSTGWQMGVSSTCLDLFTSQAYTINLTAVPVSGDLRGEGIYSDYGSYVLRTVADEETPHAVVTKYNKLQANAARYIPLCRSAKVYLRYAEAVNRLGLHRLAMAVLKYGLNATTLSNANYMGRQDLSEYPFTDFGQFNSNLATTFAGNAALHGRGSGDADMNAAYKIDISSGVDSLTDVENKIMDEYVLETAFEGGRFYDLMRISQYRRDPQYLAARVARKLSQVAGSGRSYDDWLIYLSDQRNWYLPSLKK